MRERSRVEVELHIVLLGPVDPALEVLHFYLVAIHELSSEVTVDLVEVQTVVTAKEGLYKLNILAHLVDVTCTTRVVACGLDTAAEGFVTLEAHHIVGLPAME